MSTIITNGAPLVSFLGTDDQSGRLVFPAPEETPQFLVKSFIMAPKGPTDPLLLKGSALTALYGAEVTDKTSVYFNHQVKTLTDVMATSTAMVQRVVAPNAWKADTTIYAVLTPSTTRLPKRTVTGAVIKFAGVEDLTDTPRDGFDIGFVSGPDVGNDVRNIGASTFYPILTIASSYEGSAYNNVGIGLSPLASVTDKYLEDDGFFPFLISIFDKSGSKAIKVKTLSGGLGVPFSFKPGAKDPYTRLPLDIDSRLINEYYNTTNVKRPTRVDDIGKVTTHTANIDTLLTLLAEKETAWLSATPADYDEDSTTPDVANIAWFDHATLTEETKHNINFITCKSRKGIRYGTMALMSPADVTIAATEMAVLDRVTIEALPAIIAEEASQTVKNGAVKAAAWKEAYLSARAATGVQFSTDTGAYLTGGTSGDIDYATYETLVIEKLTEYGDELSEVLDMAYHVESTFVDSGYSMAVKFAMPNVLKYRQDTNIVYSLSLPDDEVLGTVQNAGVMKTRANLIYNNLKLTAESTYFNTAVMRAVIVGGDGKFTDGSYDKRIGQSAALVKKFAGYMGAGDGSWKSIGRFDIAPGNIIDDMVDLQPKFIPDVQKPELFDAGIIWTQRFNRSLYHFPQMQTVYNDGTSVLNGTLTMFAICTLVKIGAEAHRLHTGAQRLSKLELEEKVVAYVNNRVASIFDDSFDIAPFVYFTDLDEARGYSWELNIKIGGNSMFTVETLRITALRAGDL